MSLKWKGRNLLTWSYLYSWIWLSLLFLVVVLSGLMRKREKKKTISNTDESSVLCAFTQLVTKVNCSSEAVETTTNLAKKKQLWQATTSIMFGKVERSAKKKKQNTCIGK